MTCSRFARAAALAFAGMVGFVSAAADAPAAVAGTAPGTVVRPATKATTKTTTKPAGRTARKGSSGKGVDPNAPEVFDPGDIPDNQVFVSYRPPAGGYTVRVPEGWSRSELGAVVTFTDNYNAIEVAVKAAASAPTVDSVKRGGLADVEADPSYRAGKVAMARTAGGRAVHATFQISSAPNKVTGKKVLLAVERYVYFRNGKQVSLTLSGAKGADNVDPWKIVSDSMRID